MTALPISPASLARRSREALSALGAQFLLGMGANLIGSPEENAGGERLVASIILGLHALVGIGVIVVAVRVWLAARDARVGQRAALWALIAIVLTFLIGVGTMITGSNWMSFLMSVGFVAAAALYIATGAAALARQSSSVTT